MSDGILVLSSSHDRAAIESHAIYSSVDGSPIPPNSSLGEPRRDGGTSLVVRWRGRYWPKADDYFMLLG